ncbi:MAG: hypothetical protein A2Z25_07100 [Planctomycetes bacterium RBG_16_55_9]|nr:MAG: hypothetical protein A2Z25_07100 [Planctomycetes bacterium RBG_16_55_9]
MNDVGKAIEFINRCLEPTRIVVECPKHILDERTIKKIGKYSIRKDPPHTGGDEYHAHSKLGGYEVCWTASGKRRHQNKFPADNKIPIDVKKGIADILGIETSMLECYQTTTNKKEEVYLIIIREEESNGRKIIG